MTPFPETESMTIKRIEVALRKMDFRLLKDGAYKLHEKFHSGYKFEYISALRSILDDIINNEQIPQDIKDILIPTIEDILETNNFNSQTNTISQIEQKPQQINNPQNITSQETQEPERKINAFEAFSSPKPQETIHHSFTQSPFSAQPFQEFKSYETIEKKEEIKEPAPIPTQAYYGPQNQTKQTYEPNYLRNMNVAPTQTIAPIDKKNEPIEEKQENKIKTIAIFYNQDSSDDKIKNILKYRKLLKQENIDMVELLDLLKDINAQSNTNTSELKSILEQLNLKNHLVSLITNSNSKNLIELLKATGINFSLNNRVQDIKLNIIALLGLTNLFKCTHCEEEILNDSNLLTSLVLECPHCKAPMFPSLYAHKNSTAELDMTHYNSSLISLANSKIWLVINPSIENKVSLNILRSALKVSREVKEIYIIDKDINKREACKKIFADINEQVKINAQISVIEDFLKTIE